MHLLTIKENKGRFKFLTLTLWSTTLFFTGAFLLKTSWDGFLLKFLASELLVLIFITWHLYIESKRFIIIDKNTETISIHKYNILNNRKSQVINSNNFVHVESFLTIGKNTLNVVELVTKDTFHAITVCTFLPGSNKKFLAITSDAENDKADIICKEISSFMGIKNAGFTGKRMQKQNLEKGF